MVTLFSDNGKITVAITLVNDGASTAILSSFEITVLDCPVALGPLSAIGTTANVILDPGKELVIQAEKKTASNIHFPDLCPKASIGLTLDYYQRSRPSVRFVERNIYPRPNWRKN